MNQIVTQKLDFFPSAEKIIQLVESNPPSLFLDSSMPGHRRARYSYAMIAPTKVWSGDDNPWAWLKFELAGPGTAGPFPFCGGLAGYLSYECSQFLEPFTHLPKLKGPAPLYWLGKFDAVLVLDHEKKEATLVSESESKAPALWRRLLAEESITPVPNADTPGIIKQQPDFSTYAPKIKKIRDYLEAGDIYQVNLTDRFEATFTGSAADLYQALRQESPAPYAAFLNAGDFQILSASPECLLQFSADQMATFPIKGTRRRDVDPGIDCHLKEELETSEKDLAELLMIVDLARNDLGKVCETGSVTVTDLGVTESFSQVHHRVASVTGKPKGNVSARDALAAVFPGGSVTGAPKKRAMEIIAELEEFPRSVYTGALGYFGSNGEALFNLPIRTLIKKDKQIFFSAGGGIVADSEANAEFEELLTKASGMVKALTT